MKKKHPLKRIIEAQERALKNELKNAKPIDLEMVKNSADLLVDAEWMGFKWTKVGRKSE